MNEHILSTKKLTPVQKKTFFSTGTTLVDYDAITIHYNDFKSPKKIKNAIFTSQNAVKSVKKHHKELLLGNIENCFCVGTRTSALLEENGQNVIKTSQKASHLGNFIQKTCKNEVFYFFCGSSRRDELPNSFKNSKNDIFEIKTYKTESNIEFFNQKWDKILFFSPSGVKSYTTKNNIGKALAICIGQTTALEAKKHTNIIMAPPNTTIESVLEFAVELKKL